jgi:hypothetical protein
MTFFCTPSLCGRTMKIIIRSSIQPERELVNLTLIAFQLLRTPSIPMELFKGQWHLSLTECPFPPPQDSYQKSPVIMLPNDYYPSGEDKDKNPGELLLIEAKTYEILKQYPHPNICHYYGCIRDGQYFTVVLSRHSDHHGRRLRKPQHPMRCGLHSSQRRPMPSS